MESTARMCIVMALVVLVAGPVWAEDGSAAPASVELKDGLEQTSYAVGVQIGKSLKQPGMEDLDLELLIRGFRDAMTGGPLALSDNGLTQVMTAFQQRLMARQRAMVEQEADQNLAVAQAFLDENRGKDGVIVLDSGLQYKVLREGTGRSPSATDRVKTNYRGTLVDGTEFDSSYKRGQPAEFPVNRVIPGWTEALQLMKEGAKWELYIPPNLAYGTRGSPPRIPPNSALVFDIELIEVVK